MKRWLAFVLIFTMAITLSLTGCGGKAPAAEGEEATTEETAAAEDTASSAGTTNSEKLGDMNNDYITLKGEAFEKVMTKAGENSEASLGVTMALLPVGMADLYLLTVPLVVAAEEAGGVFTGELMGMKNVDAKITGKKFTLSFEGSEGKKQNSTGEYDVEKGYLSMVVDYPDTPEEDIFIEYMKVDGGYASQYYVLSEPGKFQMMTCYFDQSAQAFGVETEAAQKPATILGTKPEAESLVKNDVYYAILKDGKLMAVDKGTSKEY